MSVVILIPKGPVGQNGRAVPQARDQRGELLQLESQVSLGQTARLTGRGKTILARAISGRLFAGSKEDGSHTMDAAESARVYPFPAPIETVAELRTRLALAEERLSELKTTLEDMRRDRDAWREQAQTRLLPAPAAPMSWWRWLRTTG